jgi:hypothetical protein
VGTIGGIFEELDEGVVTGGYGVVGHIYLFLMVLVCFLFN